MASTLSQLLHPDWVLMDVDKLGTSIYHNDEHPLTETVRNLKEKLLKEALINGSIDTLVECARTTDGLINNDWRVKIWPLLIERYHKDHIQIEPVFDDSGKSTLVSSLENSLTLNNNLHESPSTKLGNSMRLDSPSLKYYLDDLNSVDLPPHKDEDQVMLDVKRSFTVLSHFQSTQRDSFTAIYSQQDIDSLRKKLSNLIIKILRKYPCLNYYQGYHDIASIILIVCNHHDTVDATLVADEELAFRLLELLTVYHLRDFMTSNIKLSINHLRLIPAILEQADLELFSLYKKSSHATTDGLGYDYDFHPALSSILTLFSHDLSNLQHILTVWDFSMSYSSILPNVYIYAACLIFYKEKILSQLGFTGSNYEDIDQDLLHTLVSPNILLKDLSDNDLVKILSKAEDLINSYPLSSLNDGTFNVWFEKYNKNSVLSTTSVIYNEGQTQPQSQSQLNLTSSISLANILETQEHEIESQSFAEIARKQDLMESHKLATDEYSSSDYEHGYLLESSLSSLSSLSSSINLKIADTSALLFKSLFEIDWDSEKNAETDNISNQEKNEDSHGGYELYKRFYKFSITIGIFGFVLHFLITKQYPNFNCYHFLQNLTNSSEWSKEIMGMGHSMINDVGMTVKETVRSIKSSVGTNFIIGQVGLGNIRNSIFGL
ncbi:uncharacterized protein KQ657_001487 [Scheffersomyces spartinae]|uniref:Rab-GAP TBC domain-containing protein n=1 Tax=Scheffersomyces spartinae TaxID=45513 RepID=A0A9P8AI25_9ASCO|nr:uncharacterized protein KQ657_001487 [Scheffersomyces spartinae]KAG7192704.1 hypothetical protein KQ657_001487 [Scheffersomyces spartinae]